MKNVLKTSIFFILMLVMQPVFAKNVALDSIVVSENNQGYNIILNTTEKVKYQKGEENSNTTYFEISNVKAKDDTPVQYKNIKTLDSVTIQKIAQDKIRVYLKGDSTTDAKLFIQDEAGNPVYIEETIFNNDIKTNTTFVLALLFLVGIFAHPRKQKEVQITRNVYDYNHEVILNNLKQKRMIKINDFQRKEKVTNPIGNINEKTRVSDLEIMARKSA